MLVPKEVIRPGTYFYKDADTGEPRKLVVTPELTRYWHEQGNAMLSDGLTVPVPFEHDFNAHPMTPADKLLNNSGWVRGYRMEGDVLWSDVDIEDPEVAKKLPGTIRWTSPWINSFTDGRGKDWKNVISHLALTTRPRIVEQEPFGSVAAALSMATEVYNPDRPLVLSRAGLLGDDGLPAYPVAFSLFSGVALGADATGHQHKGAGQGGGQFTSGGGGASKRDPSGENQKAHNERRRQQGLSPQSLDDRDKIADQSGKDYERSQQKKKFDKEDDDFAKQPARKEYIDPKAPSEFKELMSDVKHSLSKMFGKLKALGSPEKAKAFVAKLTAKLERGVSKMFGSGGGDQQEQLDTTKKSGQSFRDKEKVKHEAAIKYHSDKYEENMAKAKEHRDAGNHTMAMHHADRASEANDALSAARKRGIGMAIGTEKPPKPDAPTDDADDDFDLDGDDDMGLEDMPGDLDGDGDADMDDASALDGPGGEMKMESLLCDLLQALGVPMPDDSNEQEFKTHLYEAVMSKIKELTSKGMGGQQQAPDQNKPPNQQPNASQPKQQQNPLIQQEQQPMYMSLQDIQKIPDQTMKAIALSMYQENQKIRAELDASKKVTDSLRDAELRKANAARATRVNLLGRLSPKVKADLDAMLSMPGMALSMGDGGAVVDPMAQTLAVLEKGLADMPRLLTVEQSALSVQAQPQDADMLTEARQDEIADHMARLMGAPAKKAS